MFNSCFWYLVLLHFSWDCNDLQVKSEVNWGRFQKGFALYFYSFFFEKFILFIGITIKYYLI